MNDTAVAQEFITHLEFDSFKKEITERIEANEQLSDLRMKKIISIINDNMTEINSSVSKLAENSRYNFTLLNERINGMNERINGMNERINNVNTKLASTNERIDHLEKFFNEKIEHVTDTLSVAINSVNQRIDDLQTAQSKSLAKWGIGVAIIIGVFQVAVSVALHFLG